MSDEDRLAEAIVWLGSGYRKSAAALFIL